jgi:protein-tyrosine-phosphatase
MMHSLFTAERVGALRAAIVLTSGRMVSAARRCLGTARHLPDRLLHPVRRRGALARLHRGETPRSILILCHGNICRSPYAEARLRSSLRPPSGSVRIASAGFHESGRRPPEEALAAASERGLEMSGHRSRLVSGEILQDAELVIVVTPRQATALMRRFGRRAGVLLLGDLDPSPNRTRAIRDPIDQPAAVFRDVYDRIDRCLEELVRALERQDPPPHGA